MKSWLIKIIHKQSKELPSKGTPGAPGGGEIGTPVLPDAQCDLFNVKTKYKRRKRRNDDEKKQTRHSPGRSWNDVAQM